MSRKRRSRFLPRLILVATLFLNLHAGFSPLPVHADERPSIIIEEIAWAGSSLSQADEWIELANLGSATATIGGWSLHGAAPLPIFLPADAEIGPYGTYRIANYPVTDEKSSVMGDVQLTTTTISLSNSSLKVELADAEGFVRDQAGVGSTPSAGSSSPKATMVRMTTSTTDIATIWMSATTSRGFKEGIMDLGAPGTCGICAVTETVPELSPGEALDLLIPETSSPTSTDPMIPEATTTTEQIITTSSTTPIPIPESVTSTPVQILVTNVPVITRPPLHFSLSEAVSNPAAGPEWIELMINETDATATDRLVELWDASGKIATITAHTAVTAPGYLVVTLSSARLNNGGDDLSLRENGVVLELTHIPALADGVGWSKTGNGTWMESDTLTPGGPNRFPLPVVAAVPVTTATSSPQTQKITVPVVVTSTTSIAPPVPTGTRLTVMLNEVLSNPDGGKEWVELWIDDVASATDRSFELWDASGRIALIPPQTLLTAPHLLLVTLQSARLNNGGDSLSLRESGGEITLDETEIPPLDKGIAWARDAASEAGGSSAWTDTDHPTPGAENILSLSPDAPENTEDASSKTTTKKSSADEIDSSLTLSENDMPKEPTAGMRVRLVGTVGSVPRLLGATHAFILLGEDGRAAITYLPKHLNTPVFGTTVRVMGTLTATERQLELRMKTSDVWMTVTTSTPPRPRDIDFLAPAMEDAWGLVSATGTVKSVASKSFVMDADGVDVTVNIPTVAGYRAQRLKKGDAVHVTGLLDPRKEMATIIVRVPEDIEIASHAPESVTAPASETKKGLPDWTPFGAAAGAVAATGGLQRLRGYLKRRKLEALATSTTPSAP